MEKYKLGNKVKIRKTSSHYGQATNLVGEIIKIHDSDDYLYKVEFSNGYKNSYRLMDLELVTLTREEVIAEAIRRYSPIKIGDKFKCLPSSKCVNNTVRSDDPSKWVFTSNKLFLTKEGDGGACVYSHGVWAEKITESFTLPEKWAVECNANRVGNSELYDWRENCIKHGSWRDKGFIHSDGYHGLRLTSNFTLITYQQFLDYVYNPWKKSIEIMSKEQSPQTVIDDTIKVGDMVEVIHISPTDEEWKDVGKVPTPFEVGDTVKVTSIGIGFEINGNYYYPKSMFKKVKKVGTKTSTDFKQKVFDLGTKYYPDWFGEYLVGHTTNDKESRVTGTDPIYYNITSATVSLTNSQFQDQFIKDQPSVGMLKFKTKLKLKID